MTKEPLTAKEEEPSIPKRNNNNKTEQPNTR